MAGDAIEVRESIEAKGDADEDIAMEDAIDAAGDDAKDDAPMKTDTDPDADAPADMDADGEPDEEVDADGEPDEGGAQPAQNIRELLNLIDETQSYLSNYKEEYVVHLHRFKQ